MSVKNNLMVRASMETGVDSCVCDMATVPNSTHDGKTTALPLFMTRKELAVFFGVTERTILRMVKRFDLPPPVAMGKLQWWETECVLSWIRERAKRKIGKAQAEMKRLKVED